MKTFPFGAIWAYFQEWTCCFQGECNYSKCKKHDVVGQESLHKATKFYHLRLGVWKRLDSDLAGWGPDTSFHFLWMCHCEELGNAAAASIARATARAAKLLHFSKLLCKWRRIGRANARSKQRVGGKSLPASMDAFSQAGPVTPPPKSFAHPANRDASSPKMNFSSSSWEGHTHNTNGAHKAACRHLNRCLCKLTSNCLVGYFNKTVMNWIAWKTMLICCWFTFSQWLQCPVINVHENSGMSCPSSKSLPRFEPKFVKCLGSGM